MNGKWRCDAQWKGTDTCLDVNCGECGAYQHYCIQMPWDGLITCDRCGAVATVSYQLQATLVSKPDFSSDTKNGDNGKREVMSEWKLITPDNTNAAWTYVIVREGYIQPSQPYSITTCNCGDYDCTHIVAHDYAYHEQAPSLADAQMIVDAINLTNKHP